MGYFKILVFVFCISSLNAQNQYRVINSNNNWRSAQPTEVEFTKFVKKNNIKVVVRLNGETSFGISTKAEAALCKKLGVTFILINPHKGYKKGQGYIISGELVKKYLKAGNCLVHCKWGFDRTGAMVGYYLRRMGKTTEFAVQHNKWKNYLKIKKGDGYKKYYETGTY